MPKPTSKPDWVSDDDPAKIIEPSAGTKLSGFLKLEKPTFQIFNWIFNNVSKWIDWFIIATRYDVIIGTGGDFPSIPAYIAGTPVAGDVVLVKSDHSLTTPITLPADVTFEFLPHVVISIPPTPPDPVLTLSTGTRLIGGFTLSLNTIASPINTVIDASSATDFTIERLDILDTSGANVISNVINLANAARGFARIKHALTNVTNNIVGAGASSNLDIVVTDSDRKEPTSVSVLSAGAGIDFSNVGAPSKLLGDYEEGQYAVDLSPGVSGFVSLFSSANTFAYIKIGNLVRVQGTVVVDFVTSPVGTLFASLPFFVAPLPQQSQETPPGLAILWGLVSDFPGTVYLTPVSFTANVSFSINAAKNTTDTLLSASLLGPGSDISVDITYITS